MPFKDQKASPRVSLFSDWQWVKFAEIIAESQPGFASGQRDPNGVIQLRMNNVDTRGNLVWDEFLRVPAEPSAIEKFRLQLGDIVFNNTNSTELVGKSALFAGHDEPIVYSNHFTRLRVKPDIADPGFVTYWLISQWQAKTFENICNRWIGQSAVKNDKLFELQIPLPPLTEQQRIAARLNEQMTAVSQARQAAEAQLRAARELPSAYLSEVFGNSAKGKWSWKKLGDVSELLPANTIKSIGDTVVTAITTACLSENGFLADGLKSARMDANDAKRALVQKGEVLIARSNTPDLVGRVSMYPGEPQNICASDLTIRIWAKPSLNPSFLTAYLSYLYLSGYWKEQAGGASGTMKKITRTQILEIGVPVPDMESQKKIMAEMQGKMDNFKQLQQSLESQLAEINRLPSVLLQRAFNP